MFVDVYGCGHKNRHWVGQNGVLGCIICIAWGFASASWGYTCAIFVYTYWLILGWTRYGTLLRMVENEARKDVWTSIGMGCFEIGHLEQKVFTAMSMRLIM
jgi:hypothetical protein